MGQLASKEKPNSIKVALVLEQWPDRPESLPSPTRSTTAPPSPRARKPYILNASIDESMSKDMDYIDQKYYNNTYAGSAASNLNTHLPPVRPRYESWRYVTYTEIMEENDKRRLSVYDIPGMKLLPTIRFHTSITHIKINLANLQTLPPEIGLLKKLMTLDLAQNALETLPSTIRNLNSLQELNLSQNKLAHVPSCVSTLTKLKILLLDYNKIKELPGELCKLSHLEQLNISGNPIKILPVEISRLEDLQKLQLDGCPIARNVKSTSLQQPMSLQEICARTIVRHNVCISSITPPHLISYISSFKTCSFCQGPYYESFVKRGIHSDRGEGQILSLEFRLCSEHWFDENSRILAMFSQTPKKVKPLNIATSQSFISHASSEDNLTLADKSTSIQENTRGNRSSATSPKSPPQSKILWPSISSLKKNRQHQELSAALAPRPSLENGVVNQNCSILASHASLKHETSSQAMV
ncbi:hypothetical protein INT43_001804 [Umbelopsis isabellina]|uniref:Uncharacterized protein n=1 Tax=Mortierella isabellina TaxID=91625 RepID=A0A8H7UES4_MORIS|nr:hypothetical protein INT43_001804 [Umbelopsis isabellina]